MKNLQGDQHGVFHLPPRQDAQRKASEIEFKYIRRNAINASTINSPSGTSLASVATKVNACRCLDAAQNEPVYDPQQHRRAPTIDCQCYLPSPKRRSSGVSVKKLSAEDNNQMETLAITAHSQ